MVGSPAAPGPDSEEIAISCDARIRVTVKYRTQFGLMGILSCQVLRDSYPRAISSVTRRDLSLEHDYDRDGALQVRNYDHFLASE
jgi:hypothetical protein